MKRKFIPWTTTELVMALNLYRSLKNNRMTMTASNPLIQQLAKAIGRTAAPAVAMRMGNFLALDSNGTKGLKNGGPSLAEFWRRHWLPYNQPSLIANPI